jgi:hypothetical protein
MKQNGFPRLLLKKSTFLSQFFSKPHKTIAMNFIPFQWICRESANFQDIYFYTDGFQFKLRARMTFMLSTNLVTMPGPIRIIFFTRIIGFQTFIRFDQPVSVQQAITAVLEYFNETNEDGQLIGDLLSETGYAYITSFRIGPNFNAHMTLDLI